MALTFLPRGKRGWPSPSALDKRRPAACGELLVDEASDDLGMASALADLAGCSLAAPAR